ncbi:MAG: hypothetical protein JWM91_3751 [Rhodospirillales bacterium]|nr:hypothetical protein [Rhodospirillales bacterium]
MDDPSDTVMETVKAREVAGVFRARGPLEAAADELLLAGFDRADIDLMASPDAVREKLGGIYVAAEELPDIPGVPRQAYVARDDAAGTLAVVAGTLGSVAATAAAFAVVASGGALAIALAAAAASGATALIARQIGQERARELEAHMQEGGLVLWVRVRSPDREKQAQEILLKHGAEAVRVHEIDIGKGLDEIPLSKLPVDPFLAEHRRLGDD